MKIDSSADWSNGLKRCQQTTLTKEGMVLGSKDTEIFGGKWNMISRQQNLTFRGNESKSINK